MDKKTTEQVYEVYTANGTIIFPSLDTALFEKASTLIVEKLIKEQPWTQKFKTAFIVKQMQEQFKAAVNRGSFKLVEREVTEGVSHGS